MEGEGIGLIGFSDNGGVHGGEHGKLLDPEPLTQKFPHSLQCLQAIFNASHETDG